MRDSILPTPNIGSASVRASATTATAPAIIAEPESSEIASGSSVMLSVTAEGDGLTYQWYEGQIGDTSNPVGTQRSSYTTPALTEITSYWVRVTNKLGSVSV